MALSNWPDHFDNSDSDAETVVVTFDDQMVVVAETEKAIGLAEDEGLPVDMWFPKSQIVGSAPKKGTWIDDLEIPQWLADEKGLDYE